MGNELRQKTEPMTGDHGRVFPLVVSRGTSIARGIITGLDVSREVTLNDDTIIVSVYAISKDVYLRWGGGVDLASGKELFDEIVVAGDTPREFSVPLQINGQLHDTVSFLQREASATVIVVEK